MQHNISQFGHACNNGLYYGKVVGLVADLPILLYCLQISSFSESKSDDKRFYIITPTKTLQLRTGCAKDRVAWIEALVTARSEYSLNGDLSGDQNDATFSTYKLRNRLHAEGVGEAIIKDCEQIVHSEFSQYHTQMRQRCEEYLSFIGSLPQEVEVILLAWLPFMKGSPDAAVMLLPCDHEVMGSSPGNSLAEMQERLRT
jgi:hypothetical protein